MAVEGRSWPAIEKALLEAEQRLLQQPHPNEVVRAATQAIDLSRTADRLWLFLVARLFNEKVDSYILEQYSQQGASLEQAGFLIACLSEPKYENYRFESREAIAIFWRAAMSGGYRKYLVGTPEVERPRTPSRGELRQLSIGHRTIDSPIVVDDVGRRLESGQKLPYDMLHVIALPKASAEWILRGLLSDDGDFGRWALDHALSVADVAGKRRVVEALVTRIEEARGLDKKLEMITIWSSVQPGEDGHEYLVRLLSKQGSSLGVEQEELAIATLLQFKKDSAEALSRARRSIENWLGMETVSPNSLSRVILGYLRAIQTYESRGAAEFEQVIRTVVSCERLRNTEARAFGIRLLQRSRQEGRR